MCHGRRVRDVGMLHARSIRAVLGLEVFGPLLLVHLSGLSPARPCVMCAAVTELVVLMAAWTVGQSGSSDF